MNDPLDPRDDAGTPLTEEEREGLMPSYVTLRSELNEAEQNNILEAREWAYGRKRAVLDEGFLNRLHQRMYGNVWRWAGRYRTMGKNIGVDAYRIPMELRLLVDDCRYWIDHGTYDPDEIAARFHHRLVSIHPYSNGNGRHARLATDLLLKSMERAPFSWGSGNLVAQGDVRSRYIAALRAADKYHIEKLLEFVRS
jgi:Fic-DOC domain mobile mystery protein B